MSDEKHKKDDDLPSIDELSRETIIKMLTIGSSAVTSPRDAAEILFHKPIHRRRSSIKTEILEHEITEEQLNNAAKFGRFLERPSDLFLKLFYNVLCTLKRDPLSGRVSPSLIGATGVMPLTIISTIPDIIEHYYHCIVHAKKEVLFATNYWQKSESASIIVQALIDLNRRAEKENRHVIVKLLIDHPTKENIIHSHRILPPSKWSEYGIPPPEQFSNISLEINNYHQMILGTFHAKFMIVDRRIALLNSNNTQDRPNLEMMSHFEGDIVNSFYDAYLISWWIPFEPNLVCLNDEALAEQDFQFGIDNANILSVKQPLKQAVARARLRLQSHFEGEEPEVYLHAPLVSDANEGFILSTQDRKESGDEFFKVATKALDNHRKSHSPTVLIQTTTHLAGGSVGYDMTPPSKPAITHHLNKSAETAHQTDPDGNLSSEELEKLAFDFDPFIFHQKHKPMPIALVNRPPYGKPIHTDTANPQDAAWMGAFRYAQKSIFIQSPTLNASPAIDGIIAACKRGIVVTLWLGLGFNDSVEGFGTFQGGTNEQVVEKLYKKLKAGNDGAENCLEVYWYVGKDQMRPLNFSQKRRNCHIKFMCIDDQVAIMGNGNMDTQSWFHSQEINAMIDSPTVIKEWKDALFKNQSTYKYGRVHIPT